MRELGGLGFGVGLGLCAAIVAPTQAVAQAEPTVDVSEFVIEGNTVLPVEAIDTALMPFLRDDVTREGLDEARAALEAAYAERGFGSVVVELPEQTIGDDGVIRLAVAEGRIGAVTVEGQRFTSQERVLADLPALAPGQVPDLNALNEQLADANARSADRQIVPELVAGTQPGTLDVKLRVEDARPLHGSAELNNQYSDGTTETRLQASLRYDDLFSRGHSVSVSAAVAPERIEDQQVYVVGYGLPTPKDGRLEISGLVSESDVTTLGTTQVRSEGESLSATWYVPFTGNPDAKFSHLFAVGAAYKNFEDILTFGPLVSRAPIEYYPLSASWYGTRADGSGVLNLDLGTTFNFRGLGDGSSAFDNRRFQASGGFIHVRAGANYVRQLPDGSELELDLRGQISNEPLVSNEQFAAGGQGTVRGYTVSTALGDSGYRLSGEVRTKDLAAGNWGLVDEVRLAAFAEGAGVYVMDPLPDTPDEFGLASIGLGLRFKLLDRVNGVVDVGVPLIDERNDRPGPQLHFRLFSDF